MRSWRVGAARDPTLAWLAPEKAGSVDPIMPRQGSTVYEESEQRTGEGAYTYSSVAF